MQERFDSFLTGMEGIYDRFRQNSPSIDGTQVGNIVQEAHSLYNTVLRYDNKTHDYVARVSEGIAHITPSLIYTPDIVHTTILDTVPDIDIDGTMEQALSTLEIGNDGIGNISFGKPVSNKDSIIIPGIPSIPFVLISDKLFDTIIAGGAPSGIKLKKPWGAHITVGRYLAVANKVTGSEVARYLNSFPELGYCRPVSVEVWKGNIGPNGFSHTILSQRKI